MDEVRRLKEQLGDARKQRQELLAERKKLLNKMETLTNKSTFSNSDKVKFDDLQNQIEPITEKVKQANTDIESYTDEVLAMGENPYWHKKNNHPGMNGFNGVASGGKDVENWKSVSEDSKGKKIKVLGPRASLKREKGLSNQGHDMADYLRDRVRGFTQNNSFANQMSTTSDSALVPEPLAAGIIDKARAKSRIFQAGARTVAMDSKTLTIAKVSGDSNVDWKKENDPHTASDVSFAPLTFKAHTLIGSVKSSVELAEDSGNLASLVEDNLASQIALELDRAAMQGSGTDPEPTGITQTAGAQIKDLGSGNGGPITDYSEFSQAYESILAANGMPNGIIYAPRTWGTLDRLTASDGQPLMAPQSYKDLTKYQTKQVPTDLTFGTANNASLAIVGDWSQLMVGIRTKVRLEVTRAASDSDGSAWENLQIWFRAYARYDIQLAHPEHFYVINAIVPAS